MTSPCAWESQCRGRPCFQAATVGRGPGPYPTLTAPRCETDANPPLCLAQSRERIRGQRGQVGAGDPREQELRGGARRARPRVRGVSQGPLALPGGGADSDSAGGMGEAHRPASRTGVEAGAPLGRLPCRGHWGLSPPLPSGEKRPPVIPQKPSLGKIQARRGRRATSDTVPGSRGLRPDPG